MEKRREYPVLADTGQAPQRPISFVVVKFSSEIEHNFLASECAIDPLNQVSGDIDIVIFQEYDTFSDILKPGEMNNLFDQFFTAIIKWMGLAGKDKLYWIFFVI